MSTICKLDFMTRQRRAMRRTFLRNPPRLPRKANSDAHALYGAIMAELHSISRAPHLHGDTKHTLFQRGSLQLKALGC